jgi:hypothetical protein
MKNTDKTIVTPFPKNGKRQPIVTFHRDGSISFRDRDGHWTHRFGELPAHMIMQLDRRTRVRLWCRNFKVERAWAEAHA